MSRFCAFTAALAFATMLQVMELGRTAETDLVLTVFLTAGLFGWHYFYEIRKMPTAAWTLGYAAVALATLTKGPQAACLLFCDDLSLSLLDKAISGVFRQTAWAGSLCLRTDGWRVAGSLFLHDRKSGGGSCFYRRCGHRRE